MSKGWEQVQFVVRCAYGHEIRRGEWAWFGRRPMVCCEAHAQQYGIARNTEESKPKPEGMTSLAELAARWKR